MKIEENTDKLLGHFLSKMVLLENEPERLDSQPERVKESIEVILTSLGSFEGTRLKGWGLLSHEFLDIIKQYTKHFGFSIDKKASLKIPFDSLRLGISCDPSLKIVWAQRYFAGLFSAYCLNSLCVEIKPSLDNQGQSEIVFTTEKAGKAPSLEQRASKKDFIHKMNNYLGGIVSYVSLQELESGKSESVDMIMKSVENIKDLLKSSFNDPLKDSFTP